MNWKKFKEITELLTDEVLNQYKDAELYAMLARSIYRLPGDDDKVLSLGHKAIDADQNHHLGYVVRGNAWSSKAEYDKAIADFDRAIELKADDATAYCNRGNVWYSKAEYDKAIADYDKAIELNPDYAAAYSNRGLAWGVKAEYDKAIAGHDKAIQLKPDDADAYYSRGNAWRSKAEYDKAIADYDKAIQLKPDFVDAYVNRGNAWGSKAEYDKAIADFDKAIELKPTYALAYNNRGNAWRSKTENDKAIADYNRAIELHPNYAVAYYNRGNAWGSKAEYDKAIADYNKAIELNPDDADAYYNRGNARKNSGKDLDQSAKDFEQYLNLAVQKDDVWGKRAKDTLEELQEKIKDAELNEIIDVISEIKKLLLISEGCVTHYTGLTVTKKLIWDSETKFRISEGAFLNDTSEGTELFKFLEYQFFTVREDGLVAETFAPKPFIGSFVAETKYDDLNLWRFYGKENGVEAKGCAVTLRLKEFVDAINRSITKGTSKLGESSEDDINFYRVAYWDHDKNKINFQIPNSTEETETALNGLMKKMKEKVKEYRTEDKSILEKHLNSIAFLFKSDAYKNENEIRLVIKGIEFEKKFDVEPNSPRVYIELINIRPLIEQITLGPKVEKPDEWAAMFYYSFDNETDDNKKPKKILISRLPYK